MMPLAVTAACFFAWVEETHTPEQPGARIVLDLGNGIEASILTSAIARRTSAEEAAEPPQGGVKEA